MSIRADLDTASRKMAECQALLRSASAAHETASNALKKAIQRAEKDGVKSMPLGRFPFNAHRSAHRPGRPPKIESDPELQAFISARIDQMTFVQIEQAVSQRFPPERRVRKSAIHAWRHRNKGSR